MRGCGVRLSSSASIAFPIRLMITRRSFSASPRSSPSPSCWRTSSIPARAMRSRKVSSAESITSGDLDVADAHLFFAREAQQVRDGALDAVQLLERHPRVLDVLGRGGILLHLLDQALGGRDRVADLVRDGSRERLHRTRVLAHHLLALALERGAHLAADLAIDEAPAQLRLDHESVEVLQVPGAAEDQHDQAHREEEDQAARS